MGFANLFAEAIAWDSKFDKDMILCKHNPDCYFHLNQIIKEHVNTSQSFTSHELILDYCFCGRGFSFH